MLAWISSLRRSKSATCASSSPSWLDVVDRTGGGDHFHVTVHTTRFDGLSLIDQHRLVYDALAAPLADGTIHELRITTRGTA